MWRKVVLMLVLAGVVQPSEEEILAAVDAFNRSAVGWRLHFERESQGSPRAVRSGELLLKRPNQARWDEGPPEDALTIADGHTLWTYEPHDHQAFTMAQEPSEMTAPLSFFFGAGRLADRFTATIEASSGCAPRRVKLKLTPKNRDPGYAYLLLVVDLTTGRTEELTLIHHGDRRRESRLRALQLESGLAAELFRFEAPPGTRIFPRAN